MRKLSKDFTLDEMLHSQTATRFGYKEQFSPPQNVIKCLEELCVHILQPLQDALGYPLYISSGYRCQRVNTAIKGSKTSQHIKGQAADIQDRKNGNAYLFNKIQELGLPFDQMIDEFGFAWVHVSYNSDAPTQRGEVLRAIKDGSNRTRYVPA